MMFYCTTQVSAAVSAVDSTPPVNIKAFSFIIYPSAPRPVGHSGLAARKTWFSLAPLRGGRPPGGQEGVPVLAGKVEDLIVCLLSHTSHPAVLAGIRGLLREKRSFRLCLLSHTLRSHVLCERSADLIPKARLLTRSPRAASPLEAPLHGGRLPGDQESFPGDEASGGGEP